MHNPPHLIIYACFGRVVIFLRRKVIFRIGVKALKGNMSLEVITNLSLLCGIAHQLDWTFL